MKRLLFPLIAFGLLAVVCCQDESGIEKEKKAIIAVIEKEKVAYFRQDLAGMDDSWIQDPSSHKFFLTPHGMTELIGWNEIHEHNMEESQRERSGVEEITQYVNYTINVYGNTALVFHDSHHTIKIQEEENLLKMRRILHMVKIADDWKIDLMAMYFHPESPKVQQSEQ
jgi:hypothetical protein